MRRTIEDFETIRRVNNTVTKVIHKSHDTLGEYFNLQKSLEQAGRMEKSSAVQAYH